MTADVRPFAFAADFRDADPVRSVAELEHEVARLRLELARAHERGRAEGAAEALARLREERDTALLGACEALTAALACLGQRFADTEQAVARLGAELALELADHLAGRAIAHDPALAVDAMIGRAVSEVRRGQPIRIRVAPALVEAVQDQVVARQKDDRRRLDVAVLPDPALPPGDACIDWDGGALLLDRAARRAAVEAEIASLLAA